MRYAKRLAVAAVALASLFVGAAPADAVTSTNVAVQGTMHIGSGIQHVATLTITGLAAGTTVGTQPSADAGFASVVLGGVAAGECLSWSGHVSGNIYRDTTVSSSLGLPGYRNVELAVMMDGAAVTFFGTAVDGAGHTKTVVGTGVAWNITRMCDANVGAEYILNATLTIAG